MKIQQDDHSFLLPVGTRVVLSIEKQCRSSHVMKPRGSTGEIVKAPNDPLHSYIVRFNDGSEVTTKRKDFEIYTQVKKGRIEESEGSSSNLARYEDHIVYECLVGSRAYGLHTEESDEDIRGVYLPPATMHWSLFGVPEQLEDHQNDRVFWEVGKFCKLALKSNPNILEILFTDKIIKVDPAFQTILDNRDAFLSKLAYNTYCGYAMAQLKKLKQDLRNRGEIRWKHAMHLIRLLLSGIHLFRHHDVLVDVGCYRDDLLSIRNAEMDFSKIDEWRLGLEEMFEKELSRTSLPDQPDYERVNGILVEMRKDALMKELTEKMLKELEEHRALLASTDNSVSD